MTIPSRSPNTSAAGINRLQRIAEILDEELVHAHQKDVAYESFLVRRLRAQWHHRQETALAWRIKRARLPEQWTLESFPFRKQLGVPRREIRTLDELDFIAKAENVVPIGPTGVGKTGLGIGLLMKALQNGHRSLFVRAQDLFNVRPEQSNIFFKLLEERYRRRPTIITTNKLCGASH